MLMNAVWSWVKLHKVAIAVLLFGVLLHFWYIFVNPTQNLYGGPGDHTAGLIWLYEQSPATPWWSYADSSAYPFGEGLWSPAYVFSQAFYILFWLCATLLQNGVAGYNLLTLILSIISYSVVYIVIQRVARTGQVATAIAAYIAVFNPFLLSLMGVGHASYLLAPAWSMGILYASAKLFAFHDRPINHKKHMVLLIILLGLAWLWDPYFILFSWLVYTGSVIGVALLNRGRLREIVKHALLVGAFASLLYLPLVTYGALQMSSIKQSVLGVRSDIKADADLYSARIKDILLPSAKNPFVPTGVKQYKKNTYHGNDPTFTTYIGISTLSIIGIYFALVYAKKIRHKKYQRKVIILSLATCVLLLLFSMPTKIHIFQLAIPTPTDILTSLVSVWRVLARAYIFALPVYLLIFASALHSILQIYKKPYTRNAVAALLFLFVCVDFLARNPLDTSSYWNIQKSIAPTYQLVAQDDDIKTLVEFPLREAPHYRGSLYFTAQLYHQKNLINATQVANLDHTTLRESLMDLDNPQTIPALRIMGADAIQVWQNYIQQWRRADKLELISDVRYDSQFGTKNFATLYRFKPDISLDGGQYVTRLNVDSRMTNGEYLYNVKQTVPTRFSSEVVNICSQQNVTMPRCALLKEYDSFTYSATLANNSEVARYAEVSTRSGSMKYTVPPKGVVAISANIDINASEVRYSLDKSEGMSIYGAHVRPIN